MLRLNPSDAGGLVTFATALPHRLFFADRLRSPDDGHADRAHPNTASRLGAIWLQSGDADGRFLPQLGATPGPNAACAAIDTHADADVLPGDGDVVMISRALGRPARGASWQHPSC